MQKQITLHVLTEMSLLLWLQNLDFNIITIDLLGCWRYVFSVKFIEIVIFNELLHKSKHLLILVEVVLWIYRLYGNFFICLIYIYLTFLINNDEMRWVLWLDWLEPFNESDFLFAHAWWTAIVILCDFALWHQVGVEIVNIALGAAH